MKPIKMTIWDVLHMPEEWQRTHTIMVYGPNKEEKIPKWFKDFVEKQFNPFVKMVTTEFKKHGWTK